MPQAFNPTPSGKRLILWKSLMMAVDCGNGKLGCQEPVRGISGRRFLSLLYLMGERNLNDGDFCWFRKRKWLRIPLFGDFSTGERRTLRQHEIDRLYTRR